MSEKQELWEIAKPFGRPPIFENPEEFWKKACEYFQWIKDNPLVEEKMFAFQGETHTGDSEKMHAMTIQGLCLHMGINSDTFYDYEKKEDFSEIVGIIRQTIFEQKFSGASAGLLNPSIIIRELGLIDKTEDVGAKPTPIEITIPVADASKKD